ncbi:hypothetical protein ACSTLM_00965, partial [Vibrio parahaemolyticus]
QEKSKEVIKTCGKHQAKAQQVKFEQTLLLWRPVCSQAANNEPEIRQRKRKEKNGNNEIIE